MSTKAQAYAQRVKQDKKYKTVPHQFDRKICHWLYCSGCGLVALKNDSTQNRIKQGCNSMED